MRPQPDGVALTPANLPVATTGGPAPLLESPAITATSIETYQVSVRYLLAVVSLVKTFTMLVSARIYGLPPNMLITLYTSVP